MTTSLETHVLLYFVPCLSCLAVSLGGCVAFHGFSQVRFNAVKLHVVAHDSSHNQGYEEDKDDGKISAQHAGILLDGTATA